MSTPFRSIVPEDAPEIFRLIEEAHAAAVNPIGPRWTIRQVEDECREGGFASCSDDGQIVSFVLFRDVGEAWEIGFLATSRNARGKGRMGQLLKYLLDRRPPGKALWLEVHEANEPARKLYLKLGMKEAGRRPRYYSDGGAAVLYNYG